MRRAWTSLLLFAFTCSASLAQVSLNKQINQIFALERQGQFANAIGVAHQLVNSNNLSGVALGRTWILLGIAYLRVDKAAEAQNALEHAIRIFESDPEYREDYAAALHSMSDLYQSMGELKVASRLEVRALNIYKEKQDHGTIVRIASNLAGLSISMNQNKEGKKYLEEALKESKLATDLDDDDNASLLALQGWLAALHHDTNTALDYYRHSLDLWKHAHGEDHQLTGWGHVLIGRSLADVGDKSTALDEVRTGLFTLDHTVGKQSPKYFAAKMAYSYVLDANGLHREASAAKEEAQQGMKNFYRDQCSGCTISVAALQ